MEGVGDHMHDQTETVHMLSAIASLTKTEEYEEIHWEGTLEDYLRLVQENPRITRNAFQRIYDMVLSYGTEEQVEQKKENHPVQILSR
jgi:serine protein kinase